MPDAFRNSRSTYFTNAGGLPSGVKWLLIANCSVFVLQYLAAHSGYGQIFNDFWLWPRAVLTLPAVWQLVTYMFLHDPRGFGHILFNMLALWMIGSDLERDWGTKLFLKYYFLCGVGAGVCVVLANLLFGSLDATDDRLLGSDLRPAAGLRRSLPEPHSAVQLPVSHQGQVLRHDPWSDRLSGLPWLQRERRQPRGPPGRHAHRIVLPEAYAGGPGEHSQAL